MDVGKVVKITNPQTRERQEVRIEHARYGNGDPALRIWDEESGEVEHVATVNLEHYGIRPGPGNVIIKAYSEGLGWTEALQRAGVVGKIVQMIGVGPYDSLCYEVPLLVGGDARENPVSGVQ